MPDELYYQREGFVFAKLHRDNWFAGVNHRPYGPGVAGNDRALAWYRGWWFFFHVVKPIGDLMGRA
jgi:hypothetical protein